MASSSKPVKIRVTPYFDDEDSFTIFKMLIHEIISNGWIRVDALEDGSFILREITPQEAEETNKAKVKATKQQSQ